MDMEQILNLRASKPYTDEEFLVVMLQVATGLLDLEDSGIAHRDIKP